MLSRFARSGRILGLLALLALLAALHGAPEPLGKEAPWLAKSDALLKAGEYDEAISYLRGCLDRPGVPERDKMDIERRLALLYWYLGQNEEAALNLRQEMAAIESEMAVQDCCARAVALRKAGNLEGSNNKFAEARQTSKSINRRDYEIKVLESWSVSYLRTPPIPRRYRDLNSEASDLACLLDYKVEASRTMNNIGIYEFMNGAFSHALSCYQKAWLYVRNLKPGEDSIRSLNNIAGVYISLGDYTKAHEYLSEAMKLLGPSTSARFGSPMTVNLGQTFLALARSCQWPEYYDEALKCFASYLDLEKRTGKTDVDLQVLNGIASISADLGRLDEAKAALAPALEALRKDRASALSGMTMLNMAVISLAAGQAAEAERYFREALDASKRSHDDLRQFRASYGLGRCAELNGQDDQAVAFYNDAIRIVAGRGSAIANDAERAEFMSRGREPFQALINLYFRLSQGGRLAVFEHEIFRTAESFRARSFLEQLERRGRQSDAVAPAPVSRQEEILAAERMGLLGRLTREARGLDRATTADLQSRVRRIDDMLDAAAFEKRVQDGPSLAPAPSVPLDVLQSSVLPDRTALIEYVLGDERSLLMCVTRNAFYLVALPSSRAIEDSLAGYLGFLEDPAMPPEKGFPAARRLYSELLEPALGRVSGDVDRLIIVPDGILFRLPFETLAVGGSGSSPRAYLNDRYAVSYSPSASSLFYIMRAPKGPYPKEALAFGVSEYGTPGRRPDTPDIVTAASVLNDLYRRNGFTIGPIPYARAEVEGLAKRLPPSAVDARFGAEATETAFKRLDLGAYRLIHLACHALSDERYPLRSSLVLSPSGEGEEDGFLEVSEMYRMRTNADLVVLSACQTGRGTIVRSEGILGLPRVFFYMGAKSVISTLWPVHDRAGAVFMGYFYDSYFRGAGKAESLRAAKRRMAGSKYSHPYYWASYTLTGGF